MNGQSDFVRRLSPYDAYSNDQRKQSIWYRLHIDLPLLCIIVSLATLGLFVLVSASDGEQFYFYRQMTFMGVGLIVMFVVAHFPPSIMQHWSYLAYLAALFMLVLVLVIGSSVKGAQRWIDLGFFSFQPSEVIKVCLPLAVANYLSQRKMPPKLKYVVVAMIIIFVPLALILKQPDLGTGLLVAASGLFVIFLAGLHWRYILIALVVVLASLPVVWSFLLHDYQKQRVLTMFNPEADKLGAGWNIIQSTTAIGSGGWSGKGWKLGTQSHLDFLPESHTDFIIAVLAEEFGFKGVLVLLTLYSLLFVRGFSISYQAKSSFSRLVAAAITSMIFVYLFVNMGMVSGILPVVGVPLPLISYGGTSLLSMFVAFGILMSISTEQERLHAS